MLEKGVDSKYIKLKLQKPSTVKESLWMLKTRRMLKTMTWDMKTLLKTSKWSLNTLVRHNVVSSMIVFWSQSQTVNHKNWGYVQVARNGENEKARSVAQLICCALCGTENITALDHSPYLPGLAAWDFYQKWKCSLMGVRRESDKQGVAALLAEVYR